MYHLKTPYILNYTCTVHYYDSDAEHSHTLSLQRFEQFPAFTIKNINKHNKTDLTESANSWGMLPVYVYRFSEER